MNEYLIGNQVDLYPASLKVLFENVFNPEFGVISDDADAIVKQLAAKAGCSPKSVEKYLRGSCHLKRHNHQWVEKNRFPIINPFDSKDINAVRMRAGETIYKRQPKARQIG